MTGTLNCSECGAPTRHALLRDACGQFRDFAELEKHEGQRAILKRAAAERG